jgi:hypothetical protein
MKFPGSKLLQQWDLSVRPLSLEDLFRSCKEIGLTGLAELRLPSTVGLIFYYLGGEVNALYREGSMAYNGALALERVRAQAAGIEGEVAVYELPLDMAHLLRGITNRQRLKETLKSSASSRLPLWWSEKMTIFSLSMSRTLTRSSASCFKARAKARSSAAGTTP